MGDAATLIAGASNKSTIRRYIETVTTNQATQSKTCYFYGVHLFSDATCNFVRVLRSHVSTFAVGCGLCDCYTFLVQTDDEEHGKNDE